MAVETKTDFLRSKKKNKNERVRLEAKILKYRQILRRGNLDELTVRRIGELIAELEQKLREIDELGVAHGRQWQDVFKAPLRADQDRNAGDAGPGGPEHRP